MAFEAMAAPLPADYRHSLNGQQMRRRLVEEIFAGSKMELIVETGTFKGDTTWFFAKFGIDVVSSEISPALHYASQQRLSGCRNVSLFYGDSRQLLESLRKRENACRKFTFFYLDAHWRDDLPLRNEIEIITSSWKNFVILIDDFKVPNDAGYGYDDYGKGKSLDLSYIKEFLKTKRVDAYLPAIGSLEETGAKRGYIFLTPFGLNGSLFASRALFLPVQI